MKPLVRAGSFFARDRAVRAAVLVALGVALLLPRALLLDASGGSARGFRDGLAAGPGPLLAGLWGIFLLGGVLILWQGIVSGTLGAGGDRTPLVRPLWRPGYYLSRHAAALLLLAGAALPTALVVRAGGGGAAARPAGVLAAALLTGWALGGLLLLLSAVLERGDVLAAVALFLAPAAADGLLVGGGVASRVLGALLPPVIALRDARHALIAGSPPDVGDVAAPVLYGTAAAALALIRLRAREFGPA